MTTDPQMPLERVPTGIPGLDTVLRGGFLRAGIYIVPGRSGDRQDERVERDNDRLLAGLLPAKKNSSR